ncbi:hypothetical protein FAVG1_10781 [Fusarium avenaceum]|nr:hypothetical protein FAVG1_10781 [Fusarium avenaceum]
MAELALAIIPIGLKTCSGLVSYLGGIKDRDDALARVARQAESLEGSFRLLDAFLKRSQLNPTISQVVDHALHCLRSCEDGLKELRELQQKLSSPVTSDAKSKDKLKDGYRKLSYPLQQSQVKQLESTLDNLCTPLNLAIQNLQLEMQQSTSEHLDRNTTRIEQTNNEVSDISTAIVSLNSPILNIQSQFPVLQNSVDALVPQINLMIQAQLRTQMEEIKLSFQAAESAAVSQRNAQTNELLSKLRIDERNHHPAIYKLVSKPSALVAVAGSISACQCRARRLRAHRSVKLGPLYLKDDVVSNIRHYKSCDFNLDNAEYSRTLTMTFNGFNRMINRAIEITLRANRGAGAFSISPSITSFTVVDVMIAPAFQVIDLLGKVYLYQLDEVYQESFLQEAVRKLQEIFRSGRTRPTDVDKNGNTLLHALMKVVGYIKNGDRELTPNILFTPGLQALAEFLITIGVPVNTVNSSDRSRIIEALFEPLGVAIIRNDAIAVDQLIQRYPEILEELNSNGETNCALAVDKPEVLKVIVRRATPAQLVQQNDIRWGRITPMGKAIWISKAICETQGGADESVCPCVAAVKILLEADCPIIPSRDFWGGFARNKNFFSKASTHCKFLVAKELRIRRRELRQVAGENLHPSEYSCLYSSEADLDYQAMELDSKLRRKGILGFGRLSTTGPSSESRIRMDTPLYASVYSNLEEPEDASIFWTFGFRDIDLSSGVWPPHDDRRNRRAKYFSHYPSPEYSLWLIEHCPRFWEFMCHHYALEGPDYVLADIIGCTIYKSTLFEQVALLKLISNKLSKVEIADSCTYRPSSYNDSSCEDEYEEEDFERARYLDDVVMEFQDFVCREDKVVDHETSDAFANGEKEYVNQDKVNHQRVLEFWNKVWPFRMQEIKEELAATWSPDQEVLKDLGVSLWYEEEVDDDKKSTAYRPFKVNLVENLVENLKRNFDLI